MTEQEVSPSERLHRQRATSASVAARTRTLVVGPYPSRRSAYGAARPEAAITNLRPNEARIDEAAGLALAIDLQVVGCHAASVDRPRPATYLGKGKVEEFAGLISAEQIDLVMMDCALSPVQQRNLEKAWGAKVIDRTGLILEIFGRRARTREGTLQVELAHLGYQKSRLVRSWTHLERQRGGFGFLGGPGETQIEADRRQIQERMTRLEKELDGVKRTRGLHRARRERVPYPTVALVGYTNAGKSTLFNRLTSAEVVAKDMLFATLDPTARSIRLPHGLNVILSDTVGFISDLPTTLVAAFRATLEDVIEADVVLHVRDVAHADADAQAADVEAILEGLGVASGPERRLVEVWNKSDLLPPDRRDQLTNAARLRTGQVQPILISAVTGEGVDGLLATIEREIGRDRITLDITLGASDGALVSWLYEIAEVLHRETADDGSIRLAVRVAPDQEPVVRARLPAASTTTPSG